MQRGYLMQGESAAKVKGRLQLEPPFPCLAKPSLAKPRPVAPSPAAPCWARLDCRTVGLVLPAKPSISLAIALALLAKLLFVETSSPQLPAVWPPARPAMVVWVGGRDFDSPWADFNSL